MTSSTYRGERAGAVTGGAGRMHRVEMKGDPFAAPFGEIMRLLSRSAA
jgi:hypothetical protein